jgi:choline-phosphate cytidylyltransferase
MSLSNYNIIFGAGAGADAGTDTNKNPSAHRQLRIYVDGVYDLFHYGHAEMLGRVRAKFGTKAIIIAGVARDDDCMKYKRQPILTQDERARSVRACRYVDEVIENAPWTITSDFLETHGIDFVCHDEASYPSGSEADIYAYVKSIGKFIAIERTPAISTSELLQRIAGRQKI